ncbi:VaFE repeat-containing surface-anchored protein [Thomasclavelia ramosa]|nr:VaFE repeat-containing surface-anchored protein [Thomasclavelia ramosa]MCM1646170.1 VaFE repeat-containing surface-anchored protein [Thomasclavelia ramosa]
MERIFCKIKRVKRKLDGKRITAKVMSAVLIASSMLNAFAPVAAYAAEPELATVSLSETQHGKLSFDGTEDMTLAVEVGTDVTVNVTPDEGYFSDGITVFKGEEDGSAVDVKEGKATFTVEGDTIVTSTFYENGSAGSAAFKSVDVDEGKAVTSVESYIRDHADVQYVGEGDELTRADVLTVTTSVVDGGKLPDATLDKLWADEDGDGFSEHWEALLSQPVSHAVLFEVDPDADYYVGWAGADIANAKLTDWGASENNADAKMCEGFIVDEATGLVYVPKSYTELNDKGEPMVASSRIQLVYTVEGESAEAVFDFNSTATDVRGDVAGKGKVSLPVTAASTKVTLATDDVALDSLTGRTIDSVTVNGIEYTPDMGMWQYNADTGSLEFAMAPAGIHAMNVKMSDNFGKGVASFFRMPEPRMSVNNIGTWEFKSAPWAGMTFRTQGINRYTTSTAGRHLPAVENPSGGKYENKTILQAMGWQGVDLSRLEAGRYSIERGCDIFAQDTGTVKINQQANLSLTCGHVGVGTNFENNPNANIGGDEDGDGNEYTDRYGQHVRVFSVSGGEAIIGVTVPTSHSQAGAGFFKIGWRVIAGHINLHKTSANPDITNGNDCYSLEGAEFTVLNATGQTMGVLTTNANGDTNTLELPEGTYTVRETKPPKGYLPAPDQQVTVHGGQTTTVQVADAPAGDPMRMVVGKYDGDKEYNDNNLPQGSASLEGAEFTIEYFDTVEYDNYEALKKAGVKPTRSWVVRTNKNGKALLSKEYLVSGDELYTDNGFVTIPRGSVAVYESKAPNGYKLNKNVSFQKIQEKPLDGVTTFNLPEIPETVIRGGVSVQKLDSETGQTPQGGADFSGITFSIINDNPNAVTVDGKSHNPGQTVKTIVTDKNGVAKTSANCLPFGKYIIRETATNDDYLNTSNEMRVTVSEDGKMYSFTAKDDIVRGGVKITKHDIETGTGDPLGGASLDGTQFEIKSLNEKPVIVGGVTYTKGQVIQPTLTIKDGEAKTGEHWLPFGLYSIQEVKAGEGYLLTDGEPHEFRIAKDGVLVNPFDGAFENQVMRSDLEFTKKGDDGQDRLAGVAFKLTSKTTGESHVVVTDENGYFSSASSWNKHTHETNANDWALDAEGVIDSSKLDATAGVWFGGTTPDDSKGALPYDTYLIEELRCTANEGYQLIETSVIVSRDGKVYDFGTLTDVKASITTKAYDPMDGDSNIGMGDYLYIEDKVAYANLFPGRSYTLVAELHDAKTGEVLYDGKTVEHTFTAQEPSGFEVVRINGIDTLELAGKTITVYEKLYDAGGSLIAKHTDKDDVNQQVTVIVPEIGTTAVDGADGDKLVSTDDAATVVDTVHYKNLIPGNRYALVGALFVKKTAEDGEVIGEPLMVDGAPVVSHTTFTPETADGDADVTFTFDSLALKDGTQLVACEVLFGLGFEPESFTDIEAATLLDLVEEPDTGLDGLYPLAYHADMEDLGQTVTIKNPKIATTALDGIDNDKNVVTDSETVIVDTVEYHNLIPGKEYTLKGSMQVKGEKDGKPVATPLEVDGKPVTAETTFTPEAAHGTVNVTFAFDSRDLEDGTQLVVFENLERNGNVLVTHEDIEDINQMVVVTVPGISTSARDGIDGDKDVVVDDETTVIDTVEYKNLVPGKEYTLNGKLYSKSTGKPLMVGDKPVTGQTVFTPEQADGKVEVTFTFDSRDLEDKTDIVLFESLVRSGTELASHADIDDKNQTVTVTHPEIGTTAVDGADGDKNVITDDTTEVIDTVEYTGLIPGKEYSLKGTLHVKVADEEGNVTEKALEVDGKPVTAETTFTPEKADGKVDVVFHFNSLTIPHDTEIVAFESLEKNGVEIAAHADIKDKAQTVTVKHPFITTSALDGIDGDKNIVTDDETVIVDTVKYSGLIPGKEYTLNGSMQVKKSDEDGTLTAEPLEVDGKPVTAETTFTPETASGEVEVTFTFDSRAIADKTDIVVFESLERTGVEIASHADIEDGKQTTTVTRPQIGTTALDGHDGDKNVVTDGKTTVIDTVEYKNVIPGKTYILKGTLHVKVADEEGNVTEKALEVDGKPVTAETTFTPEKADGKVEVTFTFDSTGIPQDTEMVAFESLEKNGVELVAHADIEDGKQTTTAHVTGISTTATDGLDGDKNVIADAETTITDEVAYENALTGTGYTMTGILMDAETGLPILTGDGSEKYTEADVAAFMQQLLDVLGLSAQDEDEGIADIVVSDETAEDGSVKKSQTVRVHADGTFEVIDTAYETDEDGLTSATVNTTGKVGYDALTDEQKEAVSDVAVLKESGIVLNYSATGELPVSIDMDALGKFIADNEDLISHLVYQTAEFTPEKYDGTVTMDFHFNANDVIDRLGGETKDIVVFEVMSKNAVADEEGSAPVIVASECDLDSEEQTVNLVPTVIGTTATDKSDGDHTLMAGKDAVITDRVTYEGLIPGKEYTLKATLMDKKTGEMLSINDQHVTAELKFTPNSQNGTIDIDLGKFDASSLDGHDLVVFEELYKQTEQGNEATEVLVAEHKDIDDEGQTVTVTTTPPGGFFGKTGGNDFFIVVSIAALAVLACGCAYYGIKNRRAAKAEDAAADEGGDTDNGDVSGDSEA